MNIFNFLHTVGTGGIRALFFALLLFFGFSAAAQNGTTMYDAIPIPMNSCGGANFYDHRYTGYGSYDYYGNPNQEIWYTFTLTRTATVNISSCSSDFDTYLHLLSGGGAYVSSNDDNGPLCTGINASLQLTIGAGTYFIVAEGSGWASGDLQLSFDMEGEAVPTIGNGIWNPIDAGTFSASGSYSNSMSNNCMPNYYGQYSGEIYYKFVLNSPADVVLSYCGSYIDTYAHLLDASGNSIAYNDDNYTSPCPGIASYITESLPAGTYYIVSEGYGGSSGMIITNLAVTMSGGGSSSSKLKYSDHNIFTVGTQGNIWPVNTGMVVPGAEGQTTTLAGNGNMGSANGTGSDASFNNPLGTATDAAGNIYVADAGNHRIRKISPAGVVTTLAGTSAGYLDGPGNIAAFQHPSALVVDGNGNVFVSDQQNHRIRKITPAGVVSTVAGSGSAGYADGIGTGASFYSPIGLALDAMGNLYVCDYGNNRIRKITANGTVSTYAGNGGVGMIDGNRLSASFQNPMGIAFDQSGNMFVADRLNNAVRKITPAGVVSTFAGNGMPGSMNGLGTSARFEQANGVAVDGGGRVFVADRSNNMVRAISPAGLVSTLAGSTSAGTSDGTGSAARFTSPYGISIDATGNLYIAENGTNNIRKVAAAGSYTINPALPAGLVLNTVTGAISGSPIAVSPAVTYTVTANNVGGAVTDSFEIEVVAAANCLLPSSNQNYVITYSPRIEGLSGTGVVTSLACDPEKVQTTIGYLDGLGRPMQTVDVMGGANNKKDMVVPITYDQFGRSVKQYQPYVELSSSDGSFKTNSVTNQANYYTAGLGPDSHVKKTSVPFGVSVYEPSALNRIIEQGAPGVDWQPVPNSTSGHTLKTEQSANGNDVKLWQMNATDDGAVTTDNYIAGTLIKIITKDENWTSGNANTTEEFRDLDGRVVLKRNYLANTHALNTYYVYDDFGNLRYVLPPAVNENGKLASPLAGFNETSTECKDWIYCYRYDTRKRLVQKRIPGKGWEYLVYNKLDQVALTQDAKLLSEGKWLFSKYDALGRLIATGQYNSSLSGAALQNQLDIDIANGGAQWEERAGTGIGYTSVAFPQTVALYHTINYYDDYSFPGNVFGNPTGNQVNGVLTKGLLTGTLINVLGTTDMLLSINYFDIYGRVEQSKNQHYLAGSVNAANYDEVNNTYSFTGQVNTSTRIHRTTITNTTIANSYIYDHGGRKKSTTTSINGGTPVVANKLYYNEIGQLKEKKLHNEMQSTTFTYNERGWLKGSSSSQFSMELDYQENGSLQYNGNISKQTYNNNGSNTFTYGYDPLNRLLNATAIGLGEVISYDVMGNITSLTRDGFGTNNYNTYDGNKLKNITGFTNSNYTYDAYNGNMVYDSGKDISFVYNHLNLPAQVSGTQNITYVYDATGRKLKKTTAAGTVNYINGIQYKTDGSIEFIQTEDGIARNNSNIYSYEYNLTDHLGNVRVTFYKNPSSGNLEVLQRDDYYAFGLRKENKPGTNNYLYNGKEFQDGLKQYDYGARFYDPEIGRWNVVDPMAERRDWLSLYNYVQNNPVLRIDPTGAFDDYYRLTENGLEFLGSDGKGDDNKIAELSNKEARELSKKLEGKKTDAITESELKKDERFVPLKSMSEAIQGSFIKNMQDAMAKDGKERGTIGVLSITRDEKGKLATADLTFGPVSIGDKDKVSFGFSGSRHVKDRYGNLAILTIHTHKHDRGLSGDPRRPDEESGAADYGNVSTTGIPWFTVGPNTSHVSYIDAYNRQQSNEYKGRNYLLDAIKYVR